MSEILGPHPYPQEWKERNFGFGFGSRESDRFRCCSFLWWVTLNMKLFLRLRFFISSWGLMILLIPSCCCGKWRMWIYEKRCFITEMLVITSFPSNLTQERARTHTHTHPSSLQLSGNGRTGNKPPKKEVGQGRLSHKQEVTETLAQAKENKTKTQHSSPRLSFKDQGWYSSRLGVSPARLNPFK